MRFVLLYIVFFCIDMRRLYCFMSFYNVSLCTCFCCIMKFCGEFYYFCCILCCYAILYYVMLCYDMLHYIVLFCIDLFFIVLLHVLCDVMLQYFVSVCIVMYNMYYFGFFM